MKTLYEIENDYSELLNRLDELCAQEEITPETLGELNALLVINQEEFTQKAEAYASVSRQKKARAEYLKNEAKRLTKMAQAEEAAAEMLKERISGAMLVMGLEKAETAHYKLSLRKSSKVEIQVPVEELATEYQRITIAPDKAAIKAARKAGKYVYGAYLYETKTLSIR